MTDKELRLIRKLGKNDTYGEALKKWCSERIKKMESIYGADSWDEIKENQGAIRELRALLGLLQEKKKTEKEKNEYL